MARASKPKKVTVHGNVRWQVRWRDDAGKQQKRNFETSREANAEHDRINGELQAGTYIDPKAGKITFAEYAEEWRQAQPHSHNTAIRVQSELRCHLLPAFGHRPMVAVRPTEVQAFVTRLSERLGHGSVRTVFRTLGAIFGAATRDRLIPWDPTDGTRLTRQDDGEVAVEQFLTVEQVDGLVGALPRRFRAIAVAAAGGGLRQGEVFGLQVPDVGFLKPKTIGIYRQIQNAGRVCPPKNKRSRVVPVGDWVIDELAAHLATYPAKGKDWIFRTSRGERVMRKSAFEHIWHAARDAVGLPEVGMHDLRHFYASMLIREGLDANTVAARLGHANPAMTWRVYVHLWPDNEDRSREAVDNVMRRRRGA
jgi:integrase